MLEEEDGRVLQRAIDGLAAICGRVHCGARFVTFEGCVGEVSFDELAQDPIRDTRSLLLDRAAVLCLSAIEATSIPRALLAGAHATPTPHGKAHRPARCSRHMAVADINAITALCEHSCELHRRLADMNSKWTSAHETVRELQAAVVAAHEETALFKEVLRSIDPRTGKTLLATDPGSVDQTHEQWARLFRQISAAARAKGDRDVPNRGGKRDAMTDAQDPLPVATCRDCARLRAAVLKIHAAIARLAGQPPSLADCSRDCLIFLDEHVLSLEMLHADRLRVEDMARQATELEAACRARLAEADAAQAQACEEVRLALTNHYEQKIAEINAVLSQERDTMAQLLDTLATRDKSIKTLNQQRENDRKAADLAAAANARSQQANLERVLLLQRDLVSARSTAEAESRRAAVADSQMLDLKAQAARLQAEIATLTASLTSAREAAEKSETSAKLSAEQLTRHMSEHRVTVTRMQDQCSALADHSRALDDRVQTLEAALVEAQAQLGTRTAELVRVGEQLQDTRQTCSSLVDQSRTTQQRHEVTLVTLTAAETRIVELEQMLRNSSVDVPALQAWTSQLGPSSSLPSARDLDTTLSAASDAAAESDDTASLTSRSSLGADYEHIALYQLDQPTPLWKAAPPSDRPSPAVKAHPPPKSTQREERRATIRRFLAQRAPSDTT